MAYGAESDRTVLFGGTTGEAPGSHSSQTWAYDGAANRWTEMKPPSGPPGRSSATMAYDVEPEMRPTVSPRSRSEFGMTHDSRSDRVLIHGGLGLSLDGETAWSYDYNTNTWHEMEAGQPHPTGRDRPEMVYDAESQRAIVFGGYRQGEETWACDLNADTWTNVTPLP